MTNKYKLMMLKLVLNQTILETIKSEYGIDSKIMKDIRILLKDEYKKSRKELDKRDMI